MTDSTFAAYRQDRTRDLYLLACGVVFGLIIGLIWAWTWIAPGRSASVTVLGAGQQVSVLVTNEQRRVLFVSGSDGAGFSNAIASALPPIGDKINVMLIDPDASADVVERARRLDYRRLILLPGPDLLETTEVAKQSFQIALGGDLVISVRVSNDSTWSATVESDATRLLIVSDGQQNVADPISLVIALNGQRPDGGNQFATVFAGPKTDESAEYPDYLAVRSGQTERIEIDSDRLSMSPDSVQNRSSGE